METIKFGKLNELSFRTSESYKALRTNVRFCGSDTKVIALTSTVPNEGKSSVSFNLARCFAEDHKTVCFVDADIRKSVIVARYERDREVPGLTHFLTKQARLSDVICIVEEIPDLYMIFTGTVAPNPSELLGSDRFAEMIKVLREKFDYVIIDCPPLGSVIDAALVAERADGVILVVESDSISYRFVQKSKEQLDKSGCRILGAVLNKVPIQSGKGYYGKYYGRYYGKYYGKYYGSYYGSDYGNEEETGKKETGGESAADRKDGWDPQVQQFGWDPQVQQFGGYSEK